MRPRGRLSFGLKAGRFAGYARDTLAQKALKNIHATLRAAGFGAPSGATVVWPQGRAGCGLSPRYSWPKELKKTITQPCRLRDLARPRGRRSFGLKARRVADYARGTLAERALKNIHPTLRAAAFNAPLGATVVWPQSRAICGLRPRHLGPKGHASEGEQGLGARQASFVSVTIILLVAEDDMINQLDAKQRGGAGDAIGQGVVLPTGARIA